MATVEQARGYAPPVYRSSESDSDSESDSEVKAPRRVPERVFEEAMGSEKKNSCFGCFKKFSGFVLDPDRPALLNAIAGEARSVYGLVKVFFQNLARIARVFAATQFTHAFSMPFDLFHLLLGFYGLVVEKGVQPKIDAALGIIGDISSLGDGISTFVSALSEVGAVSSSVMAWAGPMNIASNLLSAVFLIINARSLYYNAKMIKKLDKKVKAPDTPDYRGLYKVIKKNNYALEAQCGVDTKIVRQKIRKVFRYKHHSTAPKEERNAEFELRMAKIFSHLKMRIHHKIFTNALSMVITKIGIIATILLAFSPLCPPLAIAGVTLLGIMYLAVMFKMGFEYYSHAHFKWGMRSISDY